MASTINVSDWYWQIEGQTVLWSSARFMFVQVVDPQYQVFLAGGNFPLFISDANSLNSIMAAQVIPGYLNATGLAILSVSNSNVNSTYGLDDVTVSQIGIVARDSACGLNLPLGLASFTYPDINSVPQSFTASQIQSLYMAMRDYIAGVNIAVAALVHSQPGSLPTQPVTIA